MVNIENTLSAAAEVGCITKTFLSPIEQEGKSTKFCFHHLSALRSGLIISAFATYAGSSAFNLSNPLSSNAGITCNKLTCETSGLSVASLCGLNML